jgi:hypothetical protein
LPPGAPAEEEQIMTHPPVPAEPVARPRHPLHALTTFELRDYRRRLEHALGDKVIGTAPVAAQLRETLAQVPSTTLVSFGSTCRLVRCRILLVDSWRSRSFARRCLAIARTAVTSTRS